MPIKNFWSLNVDEAIFADELNARIRKHGRDELQVFFPINNQLKSIDLIIFNTKTRGTRTFQVKGSRSWSDENGSEYSWHQVKQNDIDPKKCDFFVFVTYNTKTEKRKLSIKPSFMIIKTDELLIIVKRDKKLGSGKTYHFNFNLAGKWFADYRDLRPHVNKDNGINFSRYFDNFTRLIRSI